MSRSSIVAAVLIAVSIGIARAQPPERFAVMPMSEPDAIAGLRTLLKSRADQDRFSGAVLVERDGRLLFEEAYGLANRTAGTPNTITTRFRIGPLSAMFTTTAILQLVQAGMLSLDGSLGRYVPDYPNGDVARVTIEQLLTHTAGTGDVFGPESRVARDELRAHEDYVRLLGARGLRFEPGARYEYSDYGLILLGIVIERVAGQSYYDYVQQRIYAPAGMTSTGSEPEARHAIERALGYTRTAGGTWQPSDTLLYRGTSARGGYSTVRDLARFAESLKRGVLLDEPHSQLLLSGRYGLMGSLGEDGSGYVGHHGGAPGTSGELRIYPQSGYVVVVLANLDPPAAETPVAYLDARLPHR